MAHDTPTGAARFTYIWQYTIKPERRDAFLTAYRSDGDWARLFARDPGYFGTELLQSSSNENVYMTIDYWTSKSARDAFRVQYAMEFAVLDRECEDYTVDETLIGDFVVHARADT